ncbi:TetR/AcrR family transcriptional regulator [Parasphingopyxis algicola]|uniref:TetR/AcrR family transcriptional regulator n=1 Tax=Parasphingopyxis algicola TaxID=2026624 RepID=UPI0015A43D9B|nr:TetR/AcrR family transcriptional regulator [Parasphingopyxis algicola]QLC25961.1 TetR/AcrR family transcriptional regulator [Parasphingopyxis algicola]
MARPQTDHDAAAEQLLEAAEQLIRERGAVVPSVTDIANACGMSQSNVYRFFPSKEALMEASVERWFRPFNDMMEEVVESDLPPREKLYQFFARRAAEKRRRYEEDRDYFMACMALGEEHHEVIMSYVDLADHYMATILAEAISDGEFPGMTIDGLMSPVNLMLAPFCDPALIPRYESANMDNLRIAINTLFNGLSAKCAEAPEASGTPLKLAS